MKLFRTLILLIFVFNTAGLAFETERVVLVIIDGLRYSEGLGDPTHAHTPRMAELAEEGALVADFQNDGATYTSRAIPAIWCGAWTDVINFNDPDCDNSSNRYAEMPTIFEYYRKHLDRPQEDCIYTLKELCPWKPSFHSEYGPDYWPTLHAEGYTDEEVWWETETIIAEQAPGFLLMYLADVDHAGHVGIWSEYLEAIAIADSLVGELWTTLQNNPLYADRTTMLVTNDHGRHDYDYQGHGDSCNGCRQIQLLAAGPDVIPGLLSPTPRVIPDITPTIGALLGFETEYATGTPMLELFDDQTAVDQGPASSTLGLSTYPNPFNGNTSIQFTLPEPGFVNLTLYNLEGRPVRTLLEQNLGSGKHEFALRSQSRDGSPLASGTYLLNIQSMGYHEVHKILLLK